MNILTLDFETYFDAEYSLKRMTTEEYVRDPRFKVLGLGVRYVNGDLKWFDDPMEILHHMQDEPCPVLCHHAHFDCLILSYHFGIRPKLILDPLPMARLVLGNHVSASLEKLAQHFGLAAKNVPYNLFRGKHWDQLTLFERDQVANGCLHDVELAWQIFNLLAKDFPASEYPVVDATVRMFTEPTLQGDIPLLGDIWLSEEKRKHALMDDLGVTEADLQSADRFAALLQEEGVEPPQKDGKNGKIYAFAKTDDFMRDLAEEESIAGDLARARLGVKSTILQTRAERWGSMATRGPMCIYLAPYAAHTLRWGGGDKTNFQNPPRDGDLRKTIVAPEGYLLAKADASQIEARLLDTLAGQHDRVEKWRNNEDQYSELATIFYGILVTKADKFRRQFGKVLKLQAGYGASERSIQRAAKNAKIPVILTIEEALQAKNLYRSSHRAVVDYWGTAGRMLARVAGGSPLEWGPLEIRDKRIYLPNGTWLNFDSLAYDQESQNWRYQTRSGSQKIWGSSLVAETTQALARVLTAGVIAEARRLGLRVVLTTHDDIVLLVKDDQWAEPTLAWLKAEMVKVPAWLPALPLAVEGELLERYG